MPQAIALNLMAVPRRPKSDRKPGGQPNHPGETLNFSERVDHHEVYPLTRCPQCHEDLSAETVMG